MMAIEPIKYLIDLIYSSKIVYAYILSIIRENRICSLAPFILPGSVLDMLRGAQKQTQSSALHKAYSLVCEVQTMNKRKE